MKISQNVMESTNGLEPIRNKVRSWTELPGIGARGAESGIGVGVGPGLDLGVRDMTVQS